VSTRPVPPPDDVDINIDNAKSEGEGEVEEEEVPVELLDTPTRQNLPTTVIIRQRRYIKRARKPRRETTWTQHYFNVTLLDEIYINKAKKG
jgi:hypothetical protein